MVDGLPRRVSNSKLNEDLRLKWTGYCGAVASRLCIGSLCAFLSLLGSALPANGAIIDVAVRAVGGLKGEGLTLVARPVSSRSDHALEAVRVPLTGLPQTIRLSLESATVWQVLVEGEAVWPTPVLLGGDGAPGSVDFVPIPAAEVSLTVAGMPAMPAGARVLAIVRPFPERKDLPQTSAACRVEGERINCRVPAVPLDLAVKVPRHASLRFWDLEPRPGVTLELGRRKLEAGSSLVAWIVDAAGVPAVGVQARLAPEAAGGVTSPDLVAAFRAAPVRTTNARGFVQFAGVEPGSHRLELDGGERGGGLVTNLQLVPGAEVELSRPVALQQPVEFGIRVDPPTTPDGEAWRITLSRESATGSLQEFSRLAADSAGFATARGLPAGRYGLTLEDPVGTVFAMRQFEVPGAAMLDVVLDLLAVEGTLTLGGDPLEAELIFGGSTGTERIGVATSEEGEFAVTLSRSGLWRIDVVSESAGVRRRMQGVRIERRDDGRPTRVDLELPDTLLEGRVVDEAGRPVEGADVAVFAVAEGVYFPFVAGRNGAFRGRGLAEGLHTLSAEGMLRDGSPGTSNLIAVDLADGKREAAPVELVLRRQWKLLGLVLGEHGEPLARALVMADGLIRGRSAGVFGADTLTAIDGTFELAVPGGTDEVLLFVGASGGHALRVIRAPVDPANVRTIQLRRGGGEIRLQLPARVDLQNPESPFPILFQDGNLLTWGVVRIWARAQGALGEWDASDYRLPSLAPGSYAVCLLSPAERAALVTFPGTFAPGPECERGTLTSGGLLEFDLR